MSGDNSTRERNTSSDLAPRSQETRRRSIQPGIIRQNAINSTIMVTINEHNMHSFSINSYVSIIFLCMHVQVLR